MPESQDARTELSELRSEVERLAAELTAMRAHAARLESLAQEDPLTGLLNRRGFFRELARAIAYHARYGTPIGLLFADLDGFKTINDEHGHEAGDRALVHIATLLRNNMRASDSVGRLGGDEFAVIIWQVADETARQKAISLEVMISASPILEGDLPLPLACSIGATLLEPGDSVEEALARADRAMFERKIAAKRQATR